MIWIYRNERFCRFTAYQAAVREDIAQDLEENARPGRRVQLVLAGPALLDVAMATTQAANARREETVDAH